MSSQSTSAGGSTDTIANQDTTGVKTARELVQASISFLKAPSERPLKEKIEFLAKNKKLEKHQLIYALQKAGLYDSSKLNELIDKLFPDSSESQLSETFATVQTNLSNPHPHPANVPPPGSAFTWLTGLATGGLALASAVGSFVASKKNAQKMIEKERSETLRKLEEIRAELREQAELDREKQHRDLMAIITLLQTQANSTQETLTQLRQSMGLIESQMKMQTSQNGMILSNVDRLSFHRPTDDDSGSQRSGRSRRSSRKDRRSLPNGVSSIGGSGGGSSEEDEMVVSSELNRRKLKQRQQKTLGVITDLLDTHVGDKDQAYDWMHQDLDAEVAALDRSSGNDLTSAVESDAAGVTGNDYKKKKKNRLESPMDTLSGYPVTTDTDGDLLASATSGTDTPGVASTTTTTATMLNDEDVPCIYHPRWKEIIDLCLDMETSQYCKSELIRLLQTWQVLIHQNSIGGGSLSSSIKQEGSLLTVSKLKSCINTVAFYISKIVQKPWMNNFRKINCCNKQFNERLKPVPLVEELLTVIGYERTQDGLFWLIDSPVPCPKTKAEFDAILSASEKKDDSSEKKDDSSDQFNLTQYIPFMSQLNFLRSLDQVLKSVFALKLSSQLEVKLNQAMVKQQIAAQKAKAESLAIQAKEKEMARSKEQDSATDAVSSVSSTSSADRATVTAVPSVSTVDTSQTDTVKTLDPVLQSDSTLKKKDEDKSADTSSGVLNEKPSLVSSSPSTPEKQESPVPYSESFINVVKKTQNGESVPGIRTDIDDMPADPTAPLSESTMEPVQKPYMNAQASSTDDWLASLKGATDTASTVTDDVKAESEEIMT